MPGIRHGRRQLHGRRLLGVDGGRGREPPPVDRRRQLAVTRYFAIAGTAMGVPAGAGAATAGPFRTSASATVLSCASHRSKSAPTSLSKFMNIPNALPTKPPLLPFIVHVTRVPAASGANVNSVAFVDANGRMNSSLMSSFDAGTAPTIVMRPSPTLSLPVQK